MAFLCPKNGVHLTLSFLVTWTLLLLAFWRLGLPLGVPPVWGQEGYLYP